MGHHLKDTTAKQTQMAVLTKLLAAPCGCRKKLYDNREKLKSY